ncbi:DUF2784 domain-containing protein [bacterium]|nr:DUF2784 domain-containing protein [bacterium]
MLLSFLNVFFHISHIAIILFTLCGWILPKTRKLHLIVVLATIVSWAGLGMFFGWGYCFWTDWHWRIRDKLGKEHPSSYIKLLADSLSGQDWNAGLIDLLTALLFAIVVAITVYVHFRQYRRTT